MIVQLQSIGIGFDLVRIHPFFLFCIFLSGGPSSFSAQVLTNLSDLGAVRLYDSGSAAMGLGSAVSAAGDFNGDGFRDVALGAPSYRTDNLEDNGSVFVVPGSLLNLDEGEIDLAIPANRLLFVGLSKSGLGWEVAALGDFNGDHFDDIAVGSESASAGYILFGNKSMERTVLAETLDKQGVEIKNTGLSVSKAGDFNGDGYYDAVFGNSEATTHSTDGLVDTHGRVTLVFGSPQPQSPLDALFPGKTHLSIRGAAQSKAGRFVAGGMDMNYDGFSDIFIGSPQGGSKQQGRAFLIHGTKQIGEDLDYPLALDAVKDPVRDAGDLNGDGYTDVALIWRRNENERDALVLWGAKPLTGTISVESSLESKAFTILKGAPSVYGVGDLNGDGFKDLAVGMPSTTVQDAGQAHFLAGRVVFIYGQKNWPQTLEMESICAGLYTGMSYTVVDGVNAYSQFGFSIAGIGDIQGDGFEDVIVGAPPDTVSLSYTIPGNSQSAPVESVYVIQGRSLYFGLQTQRSQFLSRENKKEG